MGGGADRPIAPVGVIEAKLQRGVISSKRLL